MIRVVQSGFDSDSSRNLFRETLYICPDCLAIFMADEEDLFAQEWREGLFNICVYCPGCKQSIGIQDFISEDLKKRIIHSA